MDMYSPDFFRQSYRRETWKGSKEMDVALMEGVNAGLTFEQFNGRTQCPVSLAGRYDDLKQMKAAGQTLTDEDAQKQFLEGFTQDYLLKGV